MRIISLLWKRSFHSIRAGKHPGAGGSLNMKRIVCFVLLIAMRDDWKTIYGKNVVRTGEIHWHEDYADDKISEKISGMTDYSGAA